MNILHKTVPSFVRNEQIIRFFIFRNFWDVGGEDKGRAGSSAAS